ncbi:MAG TPA: DUF302 domain-containing protein [Pyrinomonadaceae bacterium]|nr:DUF302 domain-containing protein [Pyrinomonadaceae bacterium]
MERSEVLCKAFDSADGSEFWRYPSHKVLGVFSEPDQVSGLITGLKEAGLHDDKIVVFCSRDGEKEIDFTNEKHGFWASLVQYFLALSAEHSYLEYYQKELHAGHFLVGVVVSDREQKTAVSDLMHKNGGQRITYFGSWVLEEIANKTEHEESGYAFRRKVDGSFASVLERTKNGLKDEGFGVLTEIDLKEKFKEKLDIDFPGYVILGACNPSLAYQALEEEIELGLLLPCNVVVYEKDGETVVAAIDARKMLAVTDNRKLDSFALSVNEKLRRAIDSI